MEQEWVILRQKPSKEAARIAAHSDMVREKEFFLHWDVKWNLSLSKYLTQFQRRGWLEKNVFGVLSNIWVGSYQLKDLVPPLCCPPSVLTGETVLYWLLHNYEHITSFENSFNFILSLGQLIVSKVFVGNAAPVKSENKYVHWRSVISQSDY